MKSESTGAVEGPTQRQRTSEANGRRILIVGAGHEQSPIIERARQRGMYVIAVDGNPDAPGLRHAHVQETISTKDAAGILAIARTEGIDAITSMITETPLRAIHRVATTLGLPAPSEQTVRTTTDKVAMRDAFTAYGIRNPSYARCRTRQEASSVADRIGYPMIVKPTDSGGQRGLTLCWAADDLLPAFDRASSASTDREAIIERFVPGPEINVVAVIVDGELVAMTASDREKHKNEAFGVVKEHVFPSIAAAPWEHDLRKLVLASSAAMDLQNGIIFPQFIITDEGPVLLETGARIPGGTMNELFRTATGIDLIDLHLDIALGMPGELGAYRTHASHPSAVVRFLSADPGDLTPGRVATITGEAKAARVPGIIETGYFAGTRDRTYVHPLRTGSDRYYYLLAGSEDTESARAACDEALRILDFLDSHGTSRKTSAPPAT